jgi:glycosyltransferase involved in cell wall biosynthesis
MRRDVNIKKKILFFGTQMETGGAQKLILDKANWFCENGHEVFVVFLYDKEGLHEEWKRNNTFIILNLLANPNSKIQIVEIVPSIFRFLKFLIYNKIDIVESFTIHSNVFSLPLSWLVGVKARIATYHGPVSNIPNWLQFSHKIILNSNIVTKIIAVSDEGGRNLRNKLNIKSDKLQIVHNGVKLEEIKKDVNIPDYYKEFNIPKNGIVGLGVGRLVNQKNFRMAFEVFYDIAKQYKNVYLLIAGDGDNYSQLENIIEQKNLQNCVKLLGIRKDILFLIQFSDYYISTSNSEGMSLALLEAMSFGLPIIATKVQGVNEIFSAEENEMLLEIGNKKELSTALKRMMGFTQLSGEHKCLNFA